MCDIDRLGLVEAVVDEFLVAVMGKQFGKLCLRSGIKPLTMPKRVVRVEGDHVEFWHGVSRSTVVGLLVTAVFGIIGMRTLFAIGMVIHDATEPIKLEMTAIEERLLEFFSRPLHA